MEVKRFGGRQQKCYLLLYFLERENGMKKVIRIRTISQWYLLKQLNNYLGKCAVPKEVMERIFYLLYSKSLGRDGYIALCLEKIEDDYVGVEEVLDIYPHKIIIPEDIGVIPTKTKKGNIKNWYISDISVCGQKSKIILVYKAKTDCKT